MNFLVIGPFYANANHGAEVGVVDALKELGHNVSVWDPRVSAYLTAEGVKLQSTDEGLLSEILKNDANDIILCLGPGPNDAVLSSFIWKKHKGKLKILWNSEPIRLDQYKEKIINQKKNFQMFFTFDESEIHLYKKIGIQAAFLPQAFNPNWYKPIIVSPGQRFNDYLVFIGSVGGKWAHREYFLNKIREMGFKINAATMFDAHKVNKAYNLHEAVVNLGLYVPGESGPQEHLKAFGLQQRVFEAIGASKLCITNELDKNTNNLFEHGKNILFYNKDNLREMLEIALNKKELKNLEDGVNNIRDKHTYKSRMEHLIAMIDW